MGFLQSLSRSGPGLAHSLRAREVHKVELPPHGRPALGATGGRDLMTMVMMMMMMMMMMTMVMEMMVVMMVMEMMVVMMMMMEVVMMK